MKKIFIHQFRRKTLFRLLVSVLCYVLLSLAGCDGSGSGDTTSSGSSDNDSDSDSDTDTDTYEKHGIINNIRDRLLGE